ncbi:hypothetical protein C8J57DRAFT_1718710 [Mycena rebaudengoi]|nr:hypothetical protein C8J57DRAFT_1718710 [Mycena rebaudengoi]
MVRFNFLRSMCVLAWMSGVALSQSQNVCSPTTGLCFEQFSDPALKVTVGFALPEDDDPQFADELIVLGFFPLPYGYAGVSFENATGPTVAWYTEFQSQQEAEATPFTIDFCRSEMVTLVSNQTMMPVMDSPTVWTFSPLTTWWAGESARFIFRCQNCSVLTDYFRGEQERKLTALVSTSYPQYVDATRTFANLSLDGAKSGDFVLDAKRAHFGNYSSLLSAAGAAIFRLCFLLCPRRLSHVLCLQSINKFNVKIDFICACFVTEIDAPVLALVNGFFLVSFDGR